MEVKPYEPWPVGLWDFFNLPDSKGFVHAAAFL